jgi:gentisate 1,2-dioxygenase
MDAERTRFSRETAAKNLKPLWERVMRRSPGTPAVAALWRYEDVRAYLMRAAGLITAREAERRVLMLENPALPGTGFIGSTLFAGMQLIMPAEIAAAHRHAPNALRFIVEGEGAYTSVNGERIPMRPGDFVVTRGWDWHDHGNLGSQPVIWMDGLDTPFAHLFGAHFREDYVEDTQPVSPSEGNSAPSSVFLYSYGRMRDALERLSQIGSPHPSHGYKLRYANSADGSPPFPTIAAFLQWLRAGFAGVSYRSTECTVFNVAEGSGSVHIDDVGFAFSPHDVFVVPPWASYRLSADTDCVLFSYSDRAAQEALGFWREQA